MTKSCISFTTHTHTHSAHILYFLYLYIVHIALDKIGVCIISKRLHFAPHMHLHTQIENDIFPVEKEKTPENL